MSSILHLLQRRAVERQSNPVFLIDEPEAHAIFNKVAEGQREIKLSPTPYQKSKATRERWLIRNRSKMLLYWADYRKTGKYKEGVKKWRENHREKYNTYQLKWRDANREKVRKSQRERDAERRKTDAQYKQRRAENARKSYEKKKREIIEKHGLTYWKTTQREKRMKATTSHSGIKKQILRELAKHRVAGLTNFELSEKLGLTKMQVNDSLRESVSNNYVHKGENLGIEGVNYTISERGLNYLNLKGQTVETPEPAPIVEKSVLAQKPKSNTAEKVDEIEQIKNEVKKNPLDTPKDTEHSLINAPVISNDSVIEDFEAQDTITDEINNPSHYHGQTMDVIDVIDDFLEPKMVEGYLIGNVLKYVLRYQKKGGVQSLKKAQWYLNRTIQDFDLFVEAQ
jgi:hypothetical protein